MIAEMYRFRNNVGGLLYSLYGHFLSEIKEIQLILDKKNANLL